MKLAVSAFVLAVVAAISPTAAAQDGNASDGKYCIDQLDSFRPYGTNQDVSLDRSDPFGGSTSFRYDPRQSLPQPIDLDRDGTLEQVFITTGNAAGTLHPAWQMLILIQPGSENRNDGKGSSKFVTEELTRNRTEAVGYIRAKTLTNLHRDFTLTGPGADKLPQTRHAFVEIGELSGQPGVKLRIEPYMPDYDAVAGKIVGDQNLRYEALARLNGWDEMEVLCVWKMTAAHVVPPNLRH